VRGERLAAIGAAAVLAVALAGWASAHAQTGTRAGGVWTGCGNVRSPSVVQVRRSVALAEPSWGSWVKLSVTQRSAPLVRRLYDDLCVIVGHPYQLPPGAVVDCPDDFGLTYRGVFYAAGRKLASFSYAASGCESITLSVGPQQASTMILGPAAAAEPATFDADFAAVLGVPTAAVHMPPFASGSRPVA
jgi:hypothetical protein